MGDEGIAVLRRRSGRAEFRHGRHGSHREPRGAVCGLIGGLLPAAYGRRVCAVAGVSGPCGARPAGPDPDRWAQESSVAALSGGRVVVVAVELPPTALSRRKWIVMVDGTVAARYEDINKAAPVFSPNSRRVAFVPGTRGNEF